MIYKTLSNGVKMPMLGLGVYQIRDFQLCEDIVATAIKHGYRLIDTAEVYFNEEAVGKGIKKSGINRKELFITTKVWFGGDCYDRTIKTVRESLKKLQTNYIDLVLIHSPSGDYYRSWKALEDLYKQGVIKAIGVSNFSPARLVDLCLNVEIKPMINQIEIHPFYQRTQDELWNSKYGVALESWSSFVEGKNDVFSNSILLDIAKKHNKTVAQIILRWLLQRNIIVIPKTIHEDRLIENFNVFDFELDQKDLLNIATLDENHSFFFNSQEPRAIERLFYFHHDLVIKKK